MRKKRERERAGARHGQRRFVAGCRAAAGEGVLGMGVVASDSVGAESRNFFSNF
jgi:hypothetical protein